MVNSHSQPTRLDLLAVGQAAQSCGIAALAQDECGWQILKGVLDAVGDTAIALADDSGELLLCNAAAHHLFENGITLQSLLGADARAHEHPLAVRIDGQLHYLRVYITVLSENQRQLIVARDVTAAYQYDEATHALTQQTFSATGEAFFRAVADWMAAWLEADMVLIARLRGNELVGKICRLDSAYSEAQTFQLDGTPYAETLQYEFVHYPHDLLEHFPDATELRKLGMLGYAGVPIRDESGQYCGVLAVLKRAPLSLPEPARHLLSLLAQRIAAELARYDAEETLKAGELLLRRREEILSAISYSASWLLKSDEWSPNVVETVLAWLGEAAGASRAYIYQNEVRNDAVVSLRWASWARNGILPIQETDLVDIDYDQKGLERWRNILGSGSPFSAIASNLPPAELQLLIPTTIKSILLAPIFIKKNWWGFIGFDDCHEEREWSIHEIGALWAASGVLGAALERKSVEDTLRQSAMVFETTTEGVMITDAHLRILAVNRAFSEITGYTEAEVLSNHPRLLQSGRHDKDFYTAMWASINQDGYWRGDIWNRRKSGEVYPEWLRISTVKNKHGEVTQYVAVFTDITEMKQAQERLDRLANHDPLTDLPNRRLFRETLEHALRTAQRLQQKIAVFFIDLDHFKEVNDSLGHAAGDRLLQAAAQRLRRCVRASDTVARMGGDEFTIIMESVSDPQDAALVAEKILQELSLPFELDGNEIFIGASIGISLFPNDGEDAETLVKGADAAMYQAKEQGRHNYQYYSPELTAGAFERLFLLTQLRHALEKSQFRVYYQSKVCLESGRIIGAEALVRWIHPEMGLILPGRFIALAEENGLIAGIGEYVMLESCRQLQEWRNAGLGIEHVSVNVAGPQIKQGNEFVARVSDILNKTGLEPSALELEITETFIMQRADRAIDTLDALRQLGVAMSIDDFGTGYSSLSYLKRLPIQSLKIDRSFVRDLPHDVNDIAISRAVIALAKSMGFRVVAEGVETAEQMAFLRAEGCEEAQGEFFTPPLSATEFEKRLRQAHAPAVQI